MKQTENLIIGLGIAGLNLCHQLEKAGKSFLVIDRCPENSSSLIAGGIYNPVVLKRKVKSWKVDELFPFLVQTYRELEQQLGVDFLLHDFPILKPISSAGELTEWQQAVDENRLSPYVNSVEKKVPEGPFQNSVLGSVTIKISGFVRIEKLVTAYRNYLKEKELLVEDELSYQALKTEKAITYNDISADRIVFCEGRFISENPFFNWLPFRPTKGQMLTVRVSDDLTPDRIYNQQFLLFPTEEKNIFRLGATYEWHNLDETPSQKSTKELLERAQKALNIDFEVLDAQAAIRPNVADRRPTIGRHPEMENVLLFNGMGSKGVMLAPYFAEQLINHIYEGAEIDQEVNLNRFGKRYTNS
ncbi:MAG: FAD-dependent oxidoreductase [Flavobacteriales bacterium]|nr:FAD-dependent oxidoreductase [Flavobacteriales bacterium]